MKVPDTVGVPLIVTVFDAKLPVTPVGRPVTLAPVAPLVVYVMAVIGVLMQSVCAFVPAADDKEMVLFAVTMILPAVVIVPQPPVNVTV